MRTASGCLTRATLTELYENIRRSAPILDFWFQRLQDFFLDFKISCKISRFQKRFQTSVRDFKLVTNSSGAWLAIPWGAKFPDRGAVFRWIFGTGTPNILVHVYYFAPGCKIFGSDKFPGTLVDHANNNNIINVQYDIDTGRAMTEYSYRLPPFFN